MPVERYVDASQNVALDRRVETPETTRLVRVRFPTPNTPRDVVHGLDSDPTRIGRRVVRATMTVIDAPGVEYVWTREVAWLQASAPGEALVEFYVLAGDPTYA